jgi:acyl-CoA synthetase (AMP-forming)/AMP-acid ligase II
VDQLTVNAGLLDRLAEPDESRGIRFALDPDGWDHWTYDRLARAARHAAIQIIDAGARHGDVIAIAIPSGAGFVAAYFGALLAGATPAPLVPPASSRTVRPMSRARRNSSPSPTWWPRSQSWPTS